MFKDNVIAILARVEARFEADRQAALAAKEMYGEQLCREDITQLGIISDLLGADLPGVAAETYYSLDEALKGEIDRELTSTADVMSMGEWLVIGW